jgi:hypothetical protein
MNFNVEAGVWCSIEADTEDEALDKFQERLNQAYYEHGKKGIYFSFADPQCDIDEHAGVSQTLSVIKED